MTATSKINVCLAGFAGILGSRIQRLLRGHPDISVSVGIARFDDTFRRMLFGREFGVNPPPTIAIDGSQEDVDAARYLFPGIRIVRLNELNLSEMCSIVIDATPAGLRKTEAEWRQIFQGPVVVQDGADPAWHTIALPRFSNSPSGIYRHGGCFHSAVCPIVSGFEGVTRIAGTLIMQDLDPMMEPPRHEYIASVKCPPPGKKARMLADLRRLFPEVQCEIPFVFQQPALPHYILGLRIWVSERLSVSDVRDKLRAVLHLAVLDDHVMSSAAVNLWSMEGAKVPPTLVFGHALEADERNGGTRITIPGVINYREVTALPNIAVIEVLCRDLSPLDAMRETRRKLAYGNVT